MRGETGAVAVVGLVTCKYRVVSGEALAGTSYTVGVKMGIIVRVILRFLSFVMNSYWVLGPSYNIAMKMGNCGSYFRVSFIGGGQLLGPRSELHCHLKTGNCESYFNVSFIGDRQLLGPRSQLHYRPQDG